MGTDQVVHLGRLMLTETAILIAPVLCLVVAISFVLSIIQTLTSLQDQTLTAIPRLLATGSALFFLMPWMWRHLGLYTVQTLSDFHEVLR